MINISNGSIFDAEAEAIVNPVNCVGVMGKGLALQFKNKFPDNFQYYKIQSDSLLVYLGTMCIFKTELENPKYIINFPTKFHWSDNSKLKSIETGLIDLVIRSKQAKIQSMAIPMIGCGLGGLDWKDVKPLIVDAFSVVPEIEIMLFEPY